MRSSICKVLSAKNSSLIIIDEPEMGLHNAALRSLFDALEEERSDCRFIYATHNLEFAKTRECADVFYVTKNKEGFLKPIVRKIKCDDEFTKELFIEINGIQKPILIVEGYNTDIMLYKKLQM